MIDFMKGLNLKSVKDLSEKEMLALAISLEEEDCRILGDFADAVKDLYPASADIFKGMQAEEREHHRKLVTLFQSKFGDHIPLIRREDIRGFVKRKPLWMVKPLGIEAVRSYVSLMEIETKRFYENAARLSTDASVKLLLSELAAEEGGHISSAEHLETKALTPEARRSEEDTRRRVFLLQYVQPGLAGLMDGSVSTLAPVFAAAFATHHSHETFLVGLAASIGSGISMGFTEALSDDGELTGRGHPWIRGWVCGLMTTVGGLGHTLPYLLGDFYIATVLAVVITVIELLIIAWIRYKYMETPLLRATFQVVVGGILVFIAGILIGSS
jgi:rubrerythrin